MIVRSSSPIRLALSCDQGKIDVDTSKVEEQDGGPSIPFFTILEGT
ncbi:MAG: hypothetical protein QOF62_1557 [Pyrinomonadaceae bacterium]|jgi:hypothetical protein|nr:hypothetical protein [Pyrinomonadaceae bacterium]